MDLIIDNEFRNLIPPLSDDERNQLEENIMRDGIQDPLKVWKGTLVDGHNRYEIAQKHGLTFETTEMDFADRDTVKVWIIKNQLGRRNLPPPVRIKLAMLAEPIIAAQAKARMEEGKNQYTSPEDKCPQGSMKENPLHSFQDEPQLTPSPLPTPTEKNKIDRKNKTNYQLAQMAGVSDKTVQRYKKIQQDAPDEVKTQVDSGEISINEGYKKTKNAEKVQRQEELRERKTYTPPTELPTDKFKLICADIRDGLNEIEDNSVDFIITDPPYPKEFLPLYGDLSKVAARVLKDGGSLICMTGQSYLPDVIQLLSTALNYHWCLSYVTMGDKTQIWKQRVHTAWKPLLWFVKGTRDGDWLGDDVITSPNKDKNFHEWGQSYGGMKTLIERLTYPDDTILDPFLGGGTTGLAAVTSGRKFIGADMEQSCIDTTLNRIQEVFSDGNR